MQPENVIEVRNVAKRFRVYPDKGYSLKERMLNFRRNRFEDKEVLKDISFEVRKGESFGLIGHNGCGKSTMLKLLTRIMYPDKGSVEIAGKVSSLLELGAGFHPDMSGIENIYINASIFGLSRKEIDEKIKDIIAFAELGDYINNPVRTYSSGMYMRLAFAVAINVNAEVLIVDEILAVGDVNFQRKCLNKMREIQNSGTTVVLVSHSMEQIIDVCDRCIWIQDGYVKAVGESPKVVEQYLNFMEQKVNHERDVLAQTREIPTIGSVRDVRVLVNGMRERNVMSPEDNVTLQFHYQGPKDKRVIFNIELVREDFVLCFVKTYDAQGKGYEIHDGQVTIRIEQFPMLASKYFINLKILSTDDVRIVDEAPVAGFIAEIVSESGGIVRLNSSIEVQEGEQS